MNRRDALKWMGAGAAALALPGCGPAARKPNVVFVLVDDLGWKDLGCFGATFHETPNIDALAGRGMRFTDAYAASPVCSPTRASILTGKHPARLHITDWIPGDDPQDRPLLGPADEHQLPLEEVILAEAFHEAGYATGHIGKWHLGGTDFLPQDQGYDVNVAGHHAGHPASYHYPYKNPAGFWDVPDLEGGQDGEYLTNRLTEEAVGFIQSREDRPFFLSLCYYSVHTPIQPEAENLAHFQEKLAGLPPSNEPETRPEGDAQTRLRQDHPGYAAMVRSVDQGVGRIVEVLRANGLEENTILVFMSDNGGLSTVPRPGPASVLPLRAGKGWVYEGGIRVPLIITYPGRVETGGCDTPVMSTDFYPTLLSLVGLPARPARHADGADLSPLLRQTGSLQRDFLCWHYPHYHGSGHRPASAIRQGDWKLIHWYEDGRDELYNLREDIGEMHDLSGNEPERTEALAHQLRQWLSEVNAQLPTPNPAIQ